MNKEIEVTFRISLADAVTNTDLYGKALEAPRRQVQEGKQTTMTSEREAYRESKVLTKITAKCD
ncbi:MAG: hypothetical protein HO274_10580 [Ferrovum myxofaciens]|uniref:hypothetical protein n=1 Tax=Ferrovum myxofaciens TaxID=416213 RepID=UPI0023576045|nr:hypothetical protein [Ferrovum myxofaciens]QKE41702.1 MAG: hypothetical protein HO274_10580 [Ferrovum myxofaciens]